MRSGLYNRAVTIFHLGAYLALREIVFELLVERRDVHHRDSIRKSCIATYKIS